MRYIKSTKSTIVTQKFNLIECKICGEQYTGSIKTEFRSRVNSYKSMQRKFVNKRQFQRML